MMVRCQVKGCKKESFVVYYNKDICEDHWDKYCNEKINLKKIFNIKEVKQIRNEYVWDSHANQTKIKDYAQTSLRG